MLWDIVGISPLLDAVLRWMAERVAEVINILWGLLSSAFLIVPDVTVLPQVQAVGSRALWIVNTCYVLAIIACGVVLMARDSVQARYGVTELAPRLVIGIIAANFAMPMSREFINLGNTLIQAVTGGPVADDGSLGQLQRTILAALTNPANALLTLIIGGVIATLAATIMAGWILRLGLLVILVCVGPAALACHGTLWTEPVAKLWWRAFLGVFATVGGQALALHTGLTVFVSPTANLPALGLPDDPTGTLNLLIVCCLLLAVTRIPALVRRYVTGGQSRNVVGAFVRVAVVQQLGRALTRGLLGGGCVTARAGADRTRRAPKAGGPGGGTPVGGLPLPRPARGSGTTPGPVRRRTEAAAPAQAGAPNLPPERTPGTAMPKRYPRRRR
ncbi:hypothetical protein AB0M79_28230 [Polymorphospora sp. NPDC051019]|uniref:hypothetical protein n=1 Tax=Polymorphospora sp. NPDC051019 TaxID=3155725 RepID=UPI003441B365